MGSFELIRNNKKKYKLKFYKKKSEHYFIMQVYFFSRKAYKKSQGHKILIVRW